jgi:hypothetical protein
LKNIQAILNDSKGGICKVKVDIYGSCVTRDAFEVESDFTINQYFARSSIISQYSKPLNIKQDEINLPSNFQRRMVYYDLQKIVKRYLQNPATEYLIIDLIDERMNLIKVDEDSYVTRSKEFLNANIKFKNSSVLYRQNLPENLWFKKAALFIEDIKKKFDVQKVILHKALWQEKYKTITGEIKAFENIEEISMNNQLLKMYYDFIETNIEGIRVIDLNEQFISDESHRWGKSPFHYEKAYYEAFMKELQDIIKS